LPLGALSIEHIVSEAEASAARSVLEDDPSARRKVAAGSVR
jgi:hypothetical protein